MCGRYYNSGDGVSNEDLLVTMMAVRNSEFPDEFGCDPDNNGHSGLLLIKMFLSPRALREVRTSSRTSRLSHDDCDYGEVRPFLRRVVLEGILPFLPAIVVSTMCDTLLTSTDFDLTSISDVLHSCMTVPEARRLICEAVRTTPIVLLFVTMHWWQRWERRHSLCPRDGTCVAADFFDSIRVSLDSLVVADVVPMKFPRALLPTRHHAAQLKFVLGHFPEIKSYVVTAYGIDLVRRRERFLLELLACPALAMVRESHTGRSLLSIACCLAGGGVTHRIVEFFLSTRLFDVTAVDNAGETCLELAVKTRKWKVVDLLTRS